MLEIIFHGRGGQGAVTSSEIMASAAAREGYEAQAFSFFGAERRGAPVFSFLRIDNRKILKHGMFFKADILVVLDKGLLGFPDIKKVTLKDGGSLILNVEPGQGKRYAENIKREGKTKIYSVNATKIVLKEGLVLAGWPIVNMAILGAVIKALGFPSLSSLKEAILEKFEGEVAEKNVRSATRAFDETVEEGVI